MFTENPIQEGSEVILFDEKGNIVFQGTIVNE